jgi:cytochrome c oxidase accessory protein FixG
MPDDVDQDDFRSVLASVDRTGRRTWVYAHIVAGAWRRRRSVVAALLAGLLLALPHLSIGGQPMLRLDIPHRQFAVAGQVFWPQDFSYLVLLVLMFIVATALAVALVGRLFCGWLCPHNLFLEFVYRPLERLVQGTAIQRIRRDQKGGDPLRKALTWLAYGVVSAILANTLIALFTGPGAFRYGLVLDVAGNPNAAICWVFVFAALLFNFGWFREQTCTIVCPYGRLQSAMLDPHSLLVAYDPRRGEPRGKPSATTGDCVDCGLCVAVCPTAIDIRNGSQMECLHCGACVDACNGVMAKLDRAPDLIGFSSEMQLQGKRRRLVRVRTALYGVVLIALTAVLGWRIAGRQDVEALVLRQGQLPVLAQDAEGREVVRQIMTLSLLNRTGVTATLTVALPAELEARLVTQNPLIEIPPNQRVEVLTVIDIPRRRMGPGDLHTMLTLASAGHPDRQLPITLRAP